MESDSRMGRDGNDMLQGRATSYIVLVARRAAILAFGVGLVLHLAHRGALERHDISPILHYVRDASLALIPAVAVLLAADGWARRARSRNHVAWSFVAATGYAVAMIPGMWVHEQLFGAEHIHEELVHRAGHAHGQASGAATAFVAHAAHDAAIAGLWALAILLALPLLESTVRYGTRQLRRQSPAASARWSSSPALEPVSRRRSWVTRLAAATGALGLVAAILPIIAPARAVAVATTPTCGRDVTANVVALDQTIVYNRLGVVDPEGMIFALRQDVVDRTTGFTEAEGATLTPGNVQLRSDKRPRPLTLRMNVGDCLTISFQNLLAAAGPPVVGQIQTRSVGISVLGMQLKDTILSDGSNVGQNATTAKPTAGLVAPGGTATYAFYAEREGGYELYSPSDDVSVEGIGVLAHGLFGAINVEPAGAEWYRSQVTRDDMDLATVGSTADGHPIINYDAVYPALHRFAGKPILKMLDADHVVYSDLTAVITGPGRGYFGQGGSPAYPPNASEPNRNEPFREFTVVFHDESAVIQAFNTFNDPNFLFTLHGVRDGKSINYGSGGIAAEVLANRFGVGPTANCAECKLEEFFLTSWALGDPAQIVDVPANTTDGLGNLIAGPKATKVFYPDDPSNVYHTYINDHTKFRNIHVGKEHHIFHLHSHQWLKTPDDDNSQYLDAQAIGPGTSYTYEIVWGGSGNRNKTPGDAIFHCHFYPHFAQGMWALWRSHDVFQRGTQLDPAGRATSGGLPDGEIPTGTPTPALVPLPGLAMAPMPGVESKIVNGQLDLNDNGIADYTEGWPAPAGGNPGYPFYIPGVAGHRPPSPALDMTDPADIDPLTGQPKLVNGRPVTPRVYDGGLPRHVITGGTALSTTSPLDLSKVLETASAVYPAEAGTPAEQQAMAFHSILRHDTFKPDGSAASGSNGYETNGLPQFPGAPFAQPCRNDDGTLNSTAPMRVYKAADIQLDMKLNKLGWHFPQARMVALWQDVGPLVSGAAAPEPFVMRANSGDCIDFYHTNLIPSVYEQDAYQVRTPTDIIGQHIHLVKFDVTSSDGSGNGFNYEDGTFSPDELRERIDAIRAHNTCATGAGAPDDTTCPVALAHPFFGPGPNGKWMGARTSIQRWWADPVPNNAGQDRTLGNVFTHDHFGPSTHQQTGLYATLIVEPTKSAWRDSETGNCYGDASLIGRSLPSNILQGGCTPVARVDGGPTAWRADILTADNAGVPTRNYDKESFREFYFEFSDFQHAYAAGSGATFANTPVTINGKTYTVPVATIKPDPLFAINPAGSIQNQAVSAAQPWLKVKPTLEGQADACPTGSPPPAFTVAGCPETISTADIGTFSMNYRNEPVAARVLDPAQMKQAAGDAGDLSMALSSKVVRVDPRLNVSPNFYPPLTKDVSPLDPYTPMMRTYEADRYRVRVQVGATEEGHNTSLWGAKWLQEFASPNSGWRTSQMMGISEQFLQDASASILSRGQHGGDSPTLFQR